MLISSGNIDGTIARCVARKSPSSNVPSSSTVRITAAFNASLRALILAIIVHTGQFHIVHVEMQVVALSPMYSIIPIDGAS